MSIQGVLCTVESVAIRIGTRQSLHNVFIASSLHFFGLLNLSSFCTSDLFKEL